MFRHTLAETLLFGIEAIPEYKRGRVAVEKN